MILLSLLGGDLQDGVLKLFDFGLAKEMKAILAKGDGRYDMTGNTGSRRYMAPEVAKDMDYNESVDVYSFGILLWEMCAAEKPFYGYGSGKHMQQVVLGGERPKMDSAHTVFWPSSLQWLMKKCWSEHTASRPDFTMVKQVLKDILNGKDSIPQEPQDAETSEERAPQIPGKRGGFFRPSRSRGVSLGKLPEPSFKDMPQPEKSRRARSWGFGMRR